MLVISLNTVRLQLAEEEEAALAKGDNTPVHEDITASEMLAQGLEIEDQQ